MFAALRACLMLLTIFSFACRKLCGCHEKPVRIKHRFKFRKPFQSHDTLMKGSANKSSSTIGLKMAVRWPTKRHKVPDELLRWRMMDTLKRFAKSNGRLNVTVSWRCRWGSKLEKLASKDFSFFSFLIWGRVVLQTKLCRACWPNTKAKIDWNQKMPDRSYND